MIGCFNTVNFFHSFHLTNCSYFLVAAVCHHGGAGTTAAGLRAGKPTIVVPFFGDQFFWGSMISKSGAGPPPMPGKTVTAKQLAAAFEFVRDPEVQSAALKISINFQKEKGCEVAVKSFHANLPLDKMRSDLDSTFGASFRLDEYNLQISRPVAQVLVAAGAIEESDLSPHPVYGWHTLIYSGRFESITSGFKRAVSKISDSVHRLKRSRSLSATDGRMKREQISIGRPFRDCLPLYGEIKEKPVDEQNEKENSEHKIRHSVHYGLATFMEKPYDINGQHSTPVVSSARKNTARSRQNNRIVSSKSSNQNRNTRQINKTNQHSSLSKDKNNNKSPEQKAAEMTGLSVEVCKQILSKFKEIKDKQHSSHDNDKSTHPIRMPHGRRRRARSRSTVFQ